MVNNPVNTNQQALDANARRLAALRNAKATRNFSGFLPHATGESKAVAARRNAPTQMYAAERAPNLSGAASVQQGKPFAGNDAFSHYANHQASGADVVTATKIAHPKSTIAQGELMQATLETAINSDLPGMVRAVLSYPVYAYVGEMPLLPAGSRLIGQYSSAASNGSASTRVFVIWNRVITPSGVSLMINSPGSDALGRAGMGADAINRHFWQRFGTAALLSIMGATAATAGVGQLDQPNSANLYQQSIAAAFQQSANASLSQNASIKPTLHIHQGNRLNVFVAHDLDLSSVLN